MADMHLFWLRVRCCACMQRHSIFSNVFGKLGSVFELLFNVQESKVRGLVVIKKIKSPTAVREYAANSTLTGLNQDLNSPTNFDLRNPNF